MARFKKHLNQYFEPTPIKWRIVGDIAILLIPEVIVFFQQAPELSEQIRFYGSWISSIILVAIKFATNFAYNKQ